MLDMCTTCNNHLVSARELSNHFEDPGSQDIVRFNDLIRQFGLAKHVALPRKVLFWRPEFWPAWIDEIAVVQRVRTKEWRRVVAARNYRLRCIDRI